MGVLTGDLRVEMAMVQLLSSRFLPAETTLGTRRKVAWVSQSTDSFLTFWRFIRVLIEPDGCGRAAVGYKCDARPALPLVQDALRLMHRQCDRGD